MRWYGFTGAGGRGLYDGAVWPAPSGPEPGAWTVAPPLSPLRGRVRAHRPDDLPYFLDEALWVVELDGEVREEERLISGDRGRLVARVEGWDGACAADFALACEERATGQVATAPPGAEDDLMRGYLDDLRRCVGGALPSVPAAGAAGYIGARIAAIAAGPERYAEGAAAERAEQGRWLVARLGIGT